MRDKLRKLARRLRRPDEFTDLKLREMFSAEHDITVGLYSYGCFDERRIGRNVSVGRYCSFADTAFVFRRNHGIDFLGLTPYLYNARLGVVEKDTIAHRPLVIEDDVWVGHNSIILPGCAHIGRGAVIAAGAVVTRNVRPYAIVGGNPASEIRRRFPDEIIRRIEETQWWEKTPAEIGIQLKDNPDMFFVPSQHFATSEAISVRSGDER